MILQKFGTVLVRERVGLSHESNSPLQLFCNSSVRTIFRLSWTACASPPHRRGRSDVRLKFSCREEQPPETGPPLLAASNNFNAECLLCISCYRASDRVVMTTGRVQLVEGCFLSFGAQHLHIHFGCVCSVLSKKWEMLRFAGGPRINATKGRFRYVVKATTTPTTPSPPPPPPSAASASV
jgi:hypothetical protein